MTRRNALLAAVTAAVLLLAGCSPPPAPKPPAGISEEQRRSVVQQQLDLKWLRIEESGVTLEQPELSVIRYTNWQDAGPTWADCLTEAGFKTVFNRVAGLLSRSISKGQMVNYELARYRCEAQYPLDPVESGFLSKEQARYLYNYWSNTLLPCLRSRGVDVPEVPRPGEFGEGYPTLGPEWDAYKNLRDSRGFLAPFILQECPPYPRDFEAR